MNYIVESKEKHEYMNEMIKYLDVNKDRIIKWFGLNQIPDVTIKFFTKEEYKELTEIVYKKKYEEWMVGDADFDANTINLVYLDAYKKVHQHSLDKNPNSYFDVILHEFVHICHGLILKNDSHNPEEGGWYYEVLATYLGDPNNYKNCARNIQLDRNEIYSGDSEYFNFYLIGEYMINHYTHEKMLEYAMDVDKAYDDLDIIIDEVNNWLKENKN